MIVSANGIAMHIPPPGGCGACITMSLALSNFKLGWVVAANKGVTGRRAGGYGESGVADVDDNDDGNGDW